MKSTRPILIAACGNELAGDDAFGPRVARVLRELVLDRAEVIDLGMRPAGLLDHLEERQELWIVDAAVPGPHAHAGTLLDVDYFVGERPELVHDQALSSHGLSVETELELARRLGTLPSRVRLLAAIVRETDVGRPASPELGALVQRAVETILRHLRRAGGEAQRA